jgi:peptidoglycan/xylan/chitin deacetylase (PgdA/CDA1 family)
MKKISFSVLFIAVVLQLSAQQKMIAVTFDDLPFVRINQFSNKQLNERTIRMLDACLQYNAPATGFVNLSKVYSNGVRDEAKYNLLKLWPEKGFDLGNHTFSHPDLNTTSYFDFTADIDRNENEINQLLKPFGKVMTFFRYPYLHRGTNQFITDSVAAYLVEKNYTDAAVTIDNAEWIFASAYDSLLKTGDQSLIAQLGRDYVDYMIRKTQYFDQESVKLFGRSIRHILLLHANSLNSDYADDLLQALHNEGYTFISLSEALKDDLYLTTDRFYGRGGISWLHRWAITQGKTNDFFDGEPECPAHVMKIANVEYE